MGGGGGSSLRAPQPPMQALQGGETPLRAYQSRRRNQTTAASPLCQLTNPPRGYGERSSAVVGSRPSGRNARTTGYLRTGRSRHGDPAAARAAGGIPSQQRGTRHALTDGCEARIRTEATAGSAPPTRGRPIGVIIHPPDPERKPPNTAGVIAGWATRRWALTTGGPTLQRFQSLRTSTAAHHPGGAAKGSTRTSQPLNQFDRRGHRQRQIIGCPARAGTISHLRLNEHGAGIQHGGGMSLKRSRPRPGECEGHPSGRELTFLTRSPPPCVRAAHMGPNCGATGTHYDHTVGRGVTLERVANASRWAEA